MLGVSSSIRRYSRYESFTTMLSLFGYSIPTFWLAQILMLFFALRMGWFPTSGMVDLRAQYRGLPLVIDKLIHLALPVTTLAIVQMALLTRLTKAKMIEILHKDYIITARSKGLPERRIVYYHALKNALIPVITVIGLRIGFILSGTVLIETVFGWPGIGRLMYDSINIRDYPVLMGIFIIISTTVIISNLVVDIILVLIDPRIKYK